MSVAHTIDLTLCGPTEADWEAVTSALPEAPWVRRDRLVVITPHPDDETLGAGGAIALSAAAGTPVLVVAVTDGEAGGDPVVRRREQREALDRLSDGTAEIVRLALPDGGLHDRVRSLARRLDALLRPGDRMLCPLATDGHPDHRAVSIAASSAAHRVGADVELFPVWAWHCHDPSTSPIRRGRRVDLDDDALARKLAAVACYRSQLEGPNPVVPPNMQVRLTRPFEVYVRAGGGR